MRKLLLSLFTLISFFSFSQQKHSIARTWIDVMLHMVQEDGQGPTIHARNFFHASGAMYDAWAAYDTKQETYFLGKTKRGYEIPFNTNFKKPSNNIDSLRHIAISYAFYRVMKYRYDDYGSKNRAMGFLYDQFKAFGYNPSYDSIDYENGKPEALGNYIASHIITLGQQDGSKEEDAHEPQVYQATNEVLRPELAGTGILKNPNRWQPIDIVPYIDKKGNDKTLKDWNFVLIPGNTVFLTPFWGEVIPFALPPIQHKKPVHLDPGPPPYINTENTEETEAYRWGFSLVQQYSSVLDPSLPQQWDISPKGITSLDEHLPETFEEYQVYYNNIWKNSRKKKAIKNPITKKVYKKNIVKRGDYTREIGRAHV